MKDELIFHLVTREAWKNGQHQGAYRPDSVDDEGLIRCWNGTQVEQAANEHFAKARRLLMVVVDPGHVQSRIKYRPFGDSELETPCIMGPLNIDAIIDKLKLRPDRDGRYSIEVETN